VIKTIVGELNVRATVWITPKPINKNGIRNIAVRLRLIYSKLSGPIYVNIPEVTNAQ
jgi:hypothetical protein